MGIQCQFPGCNAKVDIASILDAISSLNACVTHSSMQGPREDSGSSSDENPAIKLVER